MAKRLQMVESQIERRGVKDKSVLLAMRNVKRHLFVPESQQGLAYDDHPLSIGHGQTISQPFIVAYMSEAIELKKGEKVLEVGTGSGYQAAILAEMGADVYSIEIVKPLAESAKKRLKKLGYDQIHVKWGDGYQGWVEYAPFDAIIITAAPPEIPKKLIQQLKVGGRMIVPVGDFSQQLVLIIKKEDGIKITELIPVRFVPMVRKEDLQS